MFAAMNMPVKIDYVDMPENLSRQYQNFTEAKMGKLAARGLDAGNFFSLEDGVTDYVRNYLMREEAPYLGNDPERGL